MILPVTAEREKVTSYLCPRWGWQVKQEIISSIVRNRKDSPWARASQVENGCGRAVHEIHPGDNCRTGQGTSTGVLGSEGDAGLSIYRKRLVWQKKQKGLKTGWALVPFYLS